jgi:osmoprotectant transport system permease protein
MASSSSTSSTLTAVPASGTAVSARKANTIVAVTGATIGVAATLFGPFLSFRPNRVLDGVQVGAIDAFGVVAWVAIALWVAGAGLAFIEPGRFLGPVRGLLGTAIVTVLLAESGAAAMEFASTQGTAARTSFSASFYYVLVAFFLVEYAAVRDAPGIIGRSVIVLGAIGAIVALVASGALSELGIVREFQLTSDTFARELRRYMFYALGSTAIATVIGIPLGIWSANSASARVPIMNALNIGQVFPALAFIGIMMPVLSGLANTFPFLRDFGIAGIGWAPVFIVLVIYALFPITRNTLVAIKQLDPGVLDAARGMGMAKRRSLWEVELPLAFPVVLAGIRIALVQNTAGSILAALVGGGGLGAIVFFGLEQTSMDLVLVGVVPIVAMAFIFDSALRSVERMTGGTESELT